MTLSIGRWLDTAREKQIQTGFVFALILLGILAGYFFSGRFALVLTVIALIPIPLIVFRYPIVGLLFFGFSMTAGLYYLIPYLIQGGILGILLAVILNKIVASDYTWRFPPITIWIIVLFTWMAVGMLHLPTPPSGMMPFTLLLYGVLLFLLTCELIRTPQQLRLLLFAFAAGFIFTAGSTIYSLYSFATGDLNVSDIVSIKKMRFFGHWGGPNDLAHALMPLTALMIPFLRKQESRLKRYFILLAFSCATMSIFISMSRAGNIALFIALVFAVFVSPYRRVLVSLAVVTIAVVLMIVPSDFLSRFGAIGSKRGDVSINERSDLYAATFDESMDFFPLGGGMGAFNTYYQDYSTPIIFVPHAHQIYLYFLTEYGLPGILLYLLLLIMLFRIVLRQQFTEHKNSFERILRMSLLGTLVGICFAGFFDPAIVAPQTWFFFALISIYPYVFAPDKKEDSEQELNPTPSLQLSS